MLPVKILVNFYPVNIGAMAPLEAGAKIEVGAMASLEAKAKK